ncbi:MAG: RNA methyltransferase [Planctomycetes bacterium]|nr:RNA methyltransferase [Planctomycetota bacterium]
MESSPIRSAQNDRLKKVRALRRGKERESVLLEGARVINEALEAGIALDFLLFAEDLDEKARAVCARVSAAGIPVLAAESALLAEGSDLDAPTGVVAVASRPVVEIQEVLAGCVQRGELVLVVAGVQDPGNVGALVRVAAGLGAGAVVLLQGSASAWHPRAVRGASGTCFRLPLIESLAVEHFLLQCRIHGLPIWTAVADGENFRDLSPSACALVLGEEGRGVPAPLEKAAARRVGIPLARSVESLNVATAAAVLVAALVPGGKGA